MDALPSVGAGRPITSGPPCAPPTTTWHRSTRSWARRCANCSRPSDDAEITHSWGGPLGLPRDWHSSVGLDKHRGIAWAGGYVGDGVSTTNLAGRTLADLICGVPSDLTALPWVNHRSPAWEPEPFRWLGVNAGLWTMKLADHSEARRGRPSRLAARMERLLGH